MQTLYGAHSELFNLKSISAKWQPRRRAFDFADVSYQLPGKFNVVVGGASARINFP